MTEDRDPVLLGTLASGEAVPLFYTDRRRHLYLIGKTGTGKSTVLYAMMRADLDAGYGFALLDPHGDLAVAVADAVPKWRANDVLYLDPADLAFPLAFNPLDRVDADQRPLAAARIVAAFRHIARHRFLRSTHLVRLLPHRSDKKLIERLGALYHNGYLDRPRAQLDYYATAGSQPLVYALGGRGAALLAGLEGREPGATDWTWKNRSAGRVFLEHTLMVADVMVGLHAALATRPDILLLEPEHILKGAPEATRRARNPFKFKAHLTAPIVTSRSFPIACSVSTIGWRASGPISFSRRTAPPCR